MQPLIPGAAREELRLEQQTRMVQGLRAMLNARQVLPVSQIETHISFVLVCGDDAYKIKKALSTPFLDQSTVALREQACNEELRLNRRLAPDLYVAVVPITGTPATPEFAGSGVILDFAVKMRAFAQDGLWDRLASHGELVAAQIDDLVRVIVPFHRAADAAEPCGRLGSPAQVRAPLLESLDELDGQVRSADERACLAQLRAWEAAAFDRLRPLMEQRLVQGRVRECHGDLHLGNVTIIDGRTTVFDGIEFNEEFRWIDVMSEVAFMAMDLHAHGLPHLAHRFINGYLELCGDYDGVGVLNYYLVHRAMVRAKVDFLRAAQCAASNPGEAVRDRAAAHRYIDLALRFSRRERAPAVLMVTHGFSGSGKSTLTQGLLEAAGAIRIRSDVERKRLAALQSFDRRGGQGASGLYGEDMTAVTYSRLAQLAVPALTSGYHAILDATFLRRTQREAARCLATRQAVPFIILDFEADADVLRQRVRERAARGIDPSDADEKVLDAQLRTAEPLQPDETACVFRGVPVALSQGGAIEADWAPLLARLAAGDGATTR